MSVQSPGFGRFTGEGIDVDVWLGVTAMVALILIPILGSMAALLFLLAGLSLMAVRPKQASSDLLEFKALLVLPTFCLISVLWSDVASSSMRFSLQLGITFAIAIVLARRISLPTYLHTITVALLIIVAASIAIGHYRSDTGALVGFYASKNAMGLMAAFLTLLAMGNFSLKHWRSRQTLFAAIGVMVGIMAVILAQSISALIAISVGFSVLGAVYILRPLQPIVRATAAIVLTVLTTLLVLLAVANLEVLVDLILDLTGKDLTLTGRTVLWAVATELIAERPMLGMGFQAFWVPGNPIAETLWRQFGIESQSGFSFHNTYLSNAVEIGIIGVAIQSLMIGSAIFLAGRRALASRDRASATLLALIAMIVSMTPIDVHIYFQMSLATSIMVSTIVFSVKRRSTDNEVSSARSVARFEPASSSV